MKAQRSTAARRTARVFFSSPFGGLEEEREELTKRYWPQLSFMCSKAGYQFVPVDMRWGITSEMSSSAFTIEICLREMDRSDMIVGFFGQRYGWHGNDELLQKSFDVAAAKYPWLDKHRGKSVTELEYLHGHLNHPGQRAACFFFRDKSYDDMKLKEAQKAGDEGQMRKFRASTDGPRAAELLAYLKKRVDQSRDQCLAVHQNYATPQEGARLMFETIEKYFREVLLVQSVQELSPLEKERAQHDVFLVSSLAMGDVYEGGERYLKEIDDHVALQTPTEPATPLLVIGPAGSGKSCMLANWSARRKEKVPEEIVVYHFVGCTSDSSVPRKILHRLKEELQVQLSRLTQRDGRGSRGVTDSSIAPEKMEIRDLVRGLTAVMKDISDASLRASIVIDALDKVADSAQTVQELYWLPKEPPPGIQILASIDSDSSKEVKELVTKRRYQSLAVEPLREAEKESAALSMLKLRGKALSSEQKRKVMQKKETENPLFLKTLLKELCSFGEFFQLDKYLDGLLEASSTKELFQKFLQRAEQDYNPNKYSGNMVKDITCCIAVSRRGLSENEVKGILRLSDQAWSSIYFAMEEFLFESTGIYRFHHDELSAAVLERYHLHRKDVGDHYRSLLVDYFSDQLKQRSCLFDAVIPERIYIELPWLLMKADQLERLADCITCPPMFWNLKMDENKYDLKAYWDATGLSGVEIVAKYERAAHDHLALLYNDAEERGAAQATATRKHMVFLYEVAQYVETAGYPSVVEPVLEKVLKIYKSIYSDTDIHQDPQVARDYCEMANTLACLWADTEQFDKAEQLHNEVRELKEKFMGHYDDGKSSLAKTVNGLGVLHYLQKRYEEAEPFYQRCLELHRETLPRDHPLIPQTLNNIGANFWAQRRMEEAREALEETVRLYEEAYFGKLPPDVGGTLLNLAMVYRRLPDMDDKAEALYKRALEIRVNAYGDDHHDVAQTLLSYSAFLLFKDANQSAECAKRAAEILEKSLGLEHINTLNALENLALALVAMDRHAEAHHHFKTSGIIRHKQGRMESSIPTLNACMVDYYLNSEQSEEARQLLERLIGTSYVSDRDFAALDYLDETLLGDARPHRPFEHTIDYGLEKFPSSKMLLGRKQKILTDQGDGPSLLKILEKGEFEAEEYNLAYQELVEKGHRKEGLPIVVAAANMFPEDTIILENLTKCHIFYKDYSSAIPVAKKLVALQPTDPEARSLCGYALVMCGHIAEAREQYQHALELVQAKQDSELVEQFKSKVKFLDEM